MAPETEDELFGDSARVARALSTVVMRTLEQQQRRMQEKSRREADGYREAAQALAERERIQTDAMRAIIAPARDPAWRDKASDRDLATAYVFAEAYAANDDHARMTRDALHEHIAQHHGDVAEFVDGHVTAEQIENLPVPSDAGLSPSQERLLAARDDKALQWANLVQVQGEKQANQWLEANLDERELARLHAAELESEATAEREGAKDERERSADPTVSDAERDAGARESETLDADAAEDEERAELERAGRGLHAHDPALAHRAEAGDDEAVEAARIAQGGREEPVREQLAAHRNRRVQGRHQKANRGQDRERDHGISR